MTRTDTTDSTANGSTDSSEVSTDDRFDGGPAADEDRESATGEAVHGARAALYGAVGGALCYPDEETVETLADPEAAAGVRQAAERLGLAAEAEAFLSAWSEADLDDLRSTYNKLFGLPDGGEYPVIPYEAHYTTGSDVGESQRRIATVVGLMERFGVEPGAEFDERQDHVAAELELMQVVAAQRAVARHEGDDDAAARLAAAEATVLDEHLVGFVPALARDLEAATSNDAYAATARLAAELVRTDHRRHDSAHQTDDQRSDTDHQRSDTDRAAGITEGGDGS